MLKRALLLLGISSTIVLGALSDYNNDELSPSLSSASGSFSNSISVASQVIQFRHRGQSINVTYIVDLNDLVSTGGLLSVKSDIQRKGSSSVSSHTLTSKEIVAGPSLWTGSCLLATSYPSHTVSISSFTYTSTQAVFHVKYVFTNFNVPLTITAVYQFSLQGRTLKFRVYNPDLTQSIKSFCGYSLGPTSNTKNAQVVQIPYLPEPIVKFEGQTKDIIYWASIYLDRSKSNAYQFNSRLLNASDEVTPADYSYYMLDTTSTFQPLDETAYITVSDRVEDVFPFPKFNRPANLNFYEDQKQRLMLDMWSSSFTAVTQYLEPALAWRVDCPSPPCSVLITTSYRAAGGTCGDGAMLSVLYGTKPVWYVKVEGTQTTYQTLNITVPITTAGSTYLYFRQHSGTTFTCDTTLWRISITTSVSTYTFNNLNDFSSVQGQKNWYYYYIESGSYYRRMTWTGTAWGVEGQTYPQLASGGLFTPWVRTTSANLLTSHGNYIGALGKFGLTNLSIIVHDWQRWGYDIKFPDMYPASALVGGSASMLYLIKTAKFHGNRIALHENYVDMYPDSDLYDESALAGTPSGDFKKAWYNRETGVRALQISNEHSVRLAKQQQQRIAINYAPNAGYEDVDTSNVPSPCINLDANTRSSAATYANHFAFKKELWNQFRTSYNGPLFGEGREKDRYDVYFAGYVDGTEAQVEGKAGAALIPDFAQHVVKTSQFNQGMGYIGRWRSIDSEASIPVPIALMDILDKYRLQQIVFGNIGWLSMGTGRWGRPTFAEVFSEYYFMQPVQFFTRSQVISDISYASDNTLAWTSLGAFMTNGGDVYNPVVRLRYNGGLRIVANGKQDLLWTGYGAAGAEEFSNTFDFHGFSQWSKTGSVYSPMVWNQQNQQWNSRTSTTCRLTADYDAGNDGASYPVLVWTPPANEAIKPTSYSDIQITLPLVATSAVNLRIYAGDFSTANTSIAQWTSVYYKSFTNYNSGITVLLDSLAYGKSLIFEVTSASSSVNTCLNLKMTITATKVFSSASRQRIVAMAASGIQYTLPSNGRYTDAGDYLAYTAVQSDGKIVEYSKSSFSHYARSRDFSLRTISDIKTDGSVAFKPSLLVSGFEDIFFLNTTTVTRSGVSVISVTKRVEGTLKFTSTMSFSLELTDTTTMPTPMPSSIVFSFTLPTRWQIPSGASVSSLFSILQDESNIFFWRAPGLTLDVSTRTLKLSVHSQNYVHIDFLGTVSA